MPTFLMSSCSIAANATMTSIPVITPAPMLSATPDNGNGTEPCIEAWVCVDKIAECGEDVGRRYGSLVHLLHISFWNVLTLFAIVAITPARAAKRLERLLAPSHRRICRRRRPRRRRERRWIFVRRSRGCVRRRGGKSMSDCALFIPFSEFVVRKLCFDVRGGVLSYFVLVIGLYLLHLALCFSPAVPAWESTVCAPSFCRLALVFKSYGLGSLVVFESPAMDRS
jgi:hypothetical protein